MAVPELVIADAPYKVYPGGVIALCASDWMAAARGTLSSAADTLACTGSRVRDTQQVTANMFTNSTTALDAFAEADDTLEIPVSSLPLDSSVEYEILISLRVVGDWDTTNPDTMSGASQARFAAPRAPVAVGFYGAGTGRSTESDAVFVLRYFRGLPYYVTTDLLGIMELPQAGETMRFRAYSQVGTTLEVLLDQIIIFPYMNPNSRAISGQVNVSSSILPVDGADGGDANGEFTWAPQPAPLTGDTASEAMAYLAVPGGGDYQRVSAYANAERYTRLAAVDGQTLEYFGEKTAVAYSLAGVRYHPLETIVSDDFARTTTEGTGTSAWGDAPGGFMWVTAGSTGRTAVVESGVGKWKLPTGFSASSFLYSGGTARVTPASVYVWDAYDFSGEFRVEAAAGWPSGGGTNRADVGVRAIPLNLTQGELTLRVIFSNTAENLNFQLGFISGNTVRHTLFTGSIAAWYSPGDWIAWRIEKRRYLIRVKVWDASGAEPAAWDYTQFIPVEGVAAGSKIDYDYANNPRDAIKSNGVVGLGMYVDSFTFGAGTAYEIWWDNISVDYDPGGNPEQMSIAMERPEGTKVGEIDVPYGAAYFVYWGLRDWTDLFGANYNIAYSTRVWNDLTAAELQRAEEVFTWFGILEANIVSMNWRSAQSPHVTHVFGGSG